MPPVDGRSPGYQIQNQNPLLTTYPGNLGGKTGFTDAARHTFVTAAERDGRRLVVSVMDTENVPLRAADQAARLLDWGFATPAGTEGVGRLVRPADLAELTAAPTDPPRPDPRAGRPEPAAAPAAGDDSPLVPAALAGGSRARRRGDADRPAPGVRRSAGRRPRRGILRPGRRHRLDPPEGRRPRGREEGEPGTRLIQTSRPTAPPKADAVTLSEISDR